MRQPPPARLALIVLATLLLSSIAPHDRAAAAEPYTLSTTASYAVQVDKRRIGRAHV